MAADSKLGRGDAEGVKQSPSSSVKSSIGISRGGGKGGSGSDGGNRWCSKFGIVAMRGELSGVERHRDSWIAETDLQCPWWILRAKIMLEDGVDIARDGF